MGHNRSVGEEYKEIRKLGNGAFGDALLARHAPTKTLFVLKRLPFNVPKTEEEKAEVWLCVSWGFLGGGCPPRATGCGTGGALGGRGPWIMHRAGALKA